MPPSLPLPLPHCVVRCADLEAYDLAGVDVIYMTTTVFGEELMRRFAQRAAESLRAGSRVITLASNPLEHEAFALAGVIPTWNSWGEEEAIINVKL